VIRTRISLLLPTSTRQRPGA